MSIGLIIYLTAFESDPRRALIVYSIAAGLALTIAGGLALWGNLWLIGLAFRDSLASGLLVLFIPGYFIIFLLSRWDERRGVFCLMFGPWVTMAISLGLHWGTIAAVRETRHLADPGPDAEAPRLAEQTPPEPVPAPPVMPGPAFMPGPVPGAPDGFPAGPPDGFPAGPPGGFPVEAAHGVPDRAAHGVPDRAAPWGSRPGRAWGSRPGRAWGSRPDRAWDSRPARAADSRRGCSRRPSPARSSRRRSRRHPRRRPRPSPTTRSPRGPTRSRGR